MIFIAKYFDKTYEPSDIDWLFKDPSYRDYMNISETIQSDEFQVYNFISSSNVEFNFIKIYDKYYFVSKEDFKSKYSDRWDVFKSSEDNIRNIIDFAELNSLDITIYEFNSFVECLKITNNTSDVNIPLGEAIKFLNRDLRINNIINK